MKHHYIDNNGVKLHVVDEGEGPAVLFCHGFPSIWSLWRSQIKAVVEAGYRAIALDMRGFGESDAPFEAEAYTQLEIVGDMVAVLHHLNIDQAITVGHDHGANAVWTAAVMRPDLFPAVFGISVPFMPMGGPSFLDQLRAGGMDSFYMFNWMRPEADNDWVDAATILPRSYYWTSGLAPEGEGWDPFDPAKNPFRPAPEVFIENDPEHLPELIESFNRTGFHGGLNYYRALDTFYSLASRPFAGAVVRQPSYFVMGATDGLNKLLNVTEESLREAMPGLTGFLVLDGVGHWPQVEAPEALNKAIVDFLRKVS
ncbi:alpha/beta hydrolase [Sphingobium sp. AN641]|uniref:alpha/beta fold hydrolase n=1 Tax=Sphingobium sp. AN641 TaxID=3133443 RepID=UPI0030C45B0A